MTSTESNDPERSDEFWDLPQDINGQGAQFEPVGETDDVLSDWGLAFDVLRGRKAPTFEWTFRQVRKSRMYDLLWAGIPHVIPVSSRLIAILNAEGATGWATYPIVLLDKAGGKIHGYEGLSVQGVAGPAMWKRSKKFLAKPILPGGHRCRMLKGIWFDLSTWDGSDLFLLGKSCQLMGTDRIVRALKKGGAKGIEFTRQSDYEIPESSTKR